MRARVDHVREFHFVDAVGVKGITLTCHCMSSVKWDSNSSGFEFVAFILSWGSLWLREDNHRCSVYSFKDFEKLSVVSIVGGQRKG